MNKNILIITPKLHISGGVASYWNSLLPRLKKNKKFNITTFQVGGNGKNPFAMINEQLKFRKEVNNSSLVFLNPSLGFNSFFRDGFFAKQLISKNIPFVVFFHGWNLHFEKKVTEKYQNFFLNSFAKAKKIFVLSKDFKLKLEEWGYKGEIIIETTNVDSGLIENFNFEEKLEDINSTKTFKILFLARMIKEKGIFETIEAFNKLANNYNIELFIAGDGEDLDEVKKISKNNSKIHVLGRVEGKEKIDLFTKCHIYAFPTFYGEGLPTSILEAMAFGMPVITTNMGGLKEFFRNEEMGYLIEPNNVIALTNSLESLIKDKNKISNFSKFNFNYANEKLLNTVVAERIYIEIEKVINVK
ncbi:glycosyltransferase family 4 protein [Arcobacter sp. s6]|uniref:glycosyltransferase family 4 protein n=1 Tax=Arcobacter sp. s6 TaxID=3230363 RepID=UPI0034A0A744